MTPTPIRTTFGGLLALALLAVGAIISAAPAQASGLTWSLQSSPAGSDWSDVAFGNGTFVAVSSGPSGGVVDRVMTSADGVTWTGRSAASDATWISVIYGNGVFLAIATTGAVMTSPDGITWTSGGSTGFDTRAVSFGNGTFVANGIKSPYVVTSTDGSSWTGATGTHKAQFYGGTFGNNMFVAVGAPVGAVADSMYSNTTGSVWAPSTHVNSLGTPPVPQHQWNDVTYAAGTFVAVGQRATGLRVMTSPDGVNWTDRATVDNAWEAIVYAEGMFVAVADNGVFDRIMTSPDGITWTLEAAPAVSLWQSITYGNGVFVAVGRSGAIMTAGATGGSGGGSGGGVSGGSVLRVPEVIQQYPIATGLAVGSPAVACEANAPDYVVDGRVNAERQFDAWQLSYAAWPNGGAGGYVCTRTLSYQSGTDIWLTSGSALTGSGQLQQYAIGSAAVVRMVSDESMTASQARVAYCRTHAPESSSLGSDWGQRNEGWSPSYAMWLNDGAGGWVCSRNL